VKTDSSSLYILIIKCKIYAIYYNNRARKPLAWLQIGFYIETDNVLSAGITINDAERTEIEIENINDVDKIVKKYLSLK
jgi:hypothetical protein